MLTLKLFLLRIRLCRFQNFLRIFYHVGKPELQAKPLSEKPIAVEPSASTSKQNKKDVKPKQKADGSDSDDSDLNTSSSDDDETSDDEVLQILWAEVYFNILKLKIRWLWER